MIGKALRACGLTALAVAALVAVGSSQGASERFMLMHVSRDTTTDPRFQHETEVEPSVAAGRGGVVVTVFQVGRHSHRGAAAMGFATSRNGGRSWHNGLFTSVGRSGVSPPTALDVTDPFVVYDRVHARWIAASIADFANGSRTLQVYQSRDGIGWSGPIEVARGLVDREQLACDGSRRSRFRGRCYVVFTRDDVDRLGVRWTANAGSNWSSEAAVPAILGSPIGAVPVVRRNGRLVVVYRQGGSRRATGEVPPLALSAASSVDGGQTFGKSRGIAFVRPYQPPHFRDLSSAAPSAAVDAKGRLYAVWHSCRFRRPCRGNDLVLSRSANGARWSTPRRLPLDRRADHVIPGLAVAPARPGHGVRLGVAYYTIASDRCRPARCRIAPWFVSSANGGRTWGRPVRLHAPMRFTWLAQAPPGQAFVGDYLATAYVGTTAWPVFAAARPPSAGRLHEAIAVARVPAAVGR